MTCLKTDKIEFSIHSNTLHPQHKYINNEKRMCALTRTKKLERYVEDNYTRVKINSYSETHFNSMIH